MLGGAGVQQSHASVEVVVHRVGFDSHLPGKAESATQREVVVVAYKAVSDSHAFGIGRHIGKLDFLFLLVFVNIVDGSLGGIFFAAGYLHVGIIYQMVFVLARSQYLRFGKMVYCSAFAYMQGIAARCYGRVGHVYLIDSGALHLGKVILVIGLQRVELQTVEFAARAYERSARHCLVFHPVA